MNLPSELRTRRLLLRSWRDADRAPFAAMNADPRVMEHFPSPLSLVESDDVVERIRAHFDIHGYGFWSVEADGGFIGMVGLGHPSYETHFTPCVEVGWRIAAPHWGRGYATEGALAALSFGFDRMELGEIVAFTVPGNVRSIRVMEKIGMTRDLGGDFDHPRIAEGHPLRRHVLYRMKRGTWETRSPSGTVGMTDR